MNQGQKLTKSVAVESSGRDSEAAGATGPSDEATGLRASGVKTTVGEIAKDVRVQSKRFPLALDLEFIGEGNSGDYDEDDPDDVPLMRFTLLQREEGYAEEEVRDFEAVSDCSYSTNIRADLPQETIQALAEKLLAEFEATYDGSRYGAYRPKAQAERLSWMDGEGNALPGADRA